MTHREILHLSLINYFCDGSLQAESLAWFFAEGGANPAGWGW